MDTPRQPALSIADEFSALKTVIIGLGSPYQRDKSKVAAELHEFPFVPNTDRRAEVLALSYPAEELLNAEYANYVATLESYGVHVLRADPEAAYSFDYTCPRDIGFVVRDIFFVASMAVPSRAMEIVTVQRHLEWVDRENIVRVPSTCRLEGGDVLVLDRDTILVGINQRSNRQGYEFLQGYLAPRGLSVIPIAHCQLHLDCCLNPLARGRLLIHPESLAGNGEPVWRVLNQFEWIQVDAVEREHLAINVLSIKPSTVIARNHASCARVNRVLRDLGYRVEAIGFDGVPATGGSFRCASLPLVRLD